MMGKLELKHIAPYLPYKLKGKWGIHIFEICGASFNKRISIRVKQYNQVHAYGNGVVPILRPLSDFCGKVTGGEVKNKLNCTLKMVHEIWDLESGVLELGFISYETILCLCINHIDFQKLIEKGLAIDINTLKH